MPQRRLGSLETFQLSYASSKVKQAHFWKRCCINFPQELTCQSILYIELARAKSEALVSVIYIVYSYKIENPVMLTQFCTRGTLFLYISLPLFCTTTRRNSSNFLVTRFMCSCSHFFSLPLIFTSVAASISPFFHRRYKIFKFFFQRNWSSLFFISRSSSFSFIQVNVDIKIKSKERIGFVVVFISKSPGSYAVYRRNARVLEMQNFMPAYMNWWRYVISS